MPEPDAAPPSAAGGAWRRLLPAGRRALPPLPAGPPGSARSTGIALPQGGRLLLPRPDHLGDLLLLGPALARLRSQRPDLHLHLLVGPWSEAVARRLPGGAEVETYHFPWFDRGPRRARLRVLLSLWREVRRLRGRFDAVLVLRDDDHISAGLAAWAGIPLRLGHGHPRLLGRLSHALPEAPPARHVAALNLDLAAAALGQAPPPGDWSPADHPLGFQRLPADEKAARALLEEAMRRPAGSTAAADSVARHGIAIHPGSGAAVKRWQAAHWAALARRLLERGEPLLLTGGAAEAPLTAELAALLPEQRVLDLAGRTDLGTLAALFARCRLVLGPDSGPLHLAAAVGTPTVSLFGPADARRFGPWGPPERHHVVASAMDCAPCGRLDWTDLPAHPCVRDLEPARVLAAALGVLGVG